MKMTVHRILDAVLLCILAAYIFAGKDLAPFHADESTFIRMSRDYKYLVEGNLDRLLYRPDPAEGGLEQKIRVTTGSFNSLSIGLARRLAGLGSIPVNGFWLWDSSPEMGDRMWDENIRRGRMPDAQSLRVARIPSTLLGAAAIFLFFPAALRLTESRIAAWVGSIVLATNPLYLIHVRRAMQEGSKMFFLCLALYFAVRVLKTLESGRIDKLGTLLLGIASGVTLACKQDVAMLLAGIYVGLSLIPILLSGKRSILFPNLVLLTASACVAYALFLLLAPVWWGWWPAALLLASLALLLYQSTPLEWAGRSKRFLLVPIGLLAGVTIASPNVWIRVTEPIQLMADARKEVMTAQLDYRVRNGLFNLDTPGKKAAHLAKTVFDSNSMGTDSPRFDIARTREQKRAYLESFLSGRHGLRLIDVLIGALFAAGIWKTVRHFGADSILVLSMLLLSALILFLSTPLPFDRYFLVLQIPYALLAGIGAQQLRARQSS